MNRKKNKSKNEEKEYNSYVMQGTESQPNDILLSA